jgi:Na+/proline symporter
VIWTDVFQFVVIFGSLASIFVISLGKLGGFQTIWMKAVDGGRLDIFEYSFPIFLSTHQLVLFSVLI